MVAAAEVVDLGHGAGDRRRAVVLIGGLPARGRGAARRRRRVAAGGARTGRQPAAARGRGATPRRCAIRRANLVTAGPLDRQKVHVFWHVDLLGVRAGLLLDVDRCHRRAGSVV